MTLQVKNFAISLRRSLLPNESPNFVLACSGGVDSIALLDLLFRSRMAPYLICYVNHAQRPRPEIKKDIAAIQKHLDRLRREGLLSDRVKFKILKLTRGTAPRRSSSESTLRTARYDLLSRTVVRANVQRPILLTAHHADDQLETFLMRWLRGAHVETLRGLQERSHWKGLPLYRPLLSYTKAEIVQYANSCGLAWNEDSTNILSKFTRNRIRNELIPLMESLYSGSTRRALQFFLDIKLRETAAPSQELLKKLQSPKGLWVGAVSFAELKASLDFALGPKASRTTRAQWDAVRQLLLVRGSKKVMVKVNEKKIQFPGGACLFFKGHHMYWEQCSH